ncbi:MAG TPA: sugar kinase [Spirochaetia bacterium]|nr:sugar kinase [Spirochaetia bacterium]
MKTFEVWAMGELLVEIMRPRRGMSLSEAGDFLGPFPSGSTGIFIDTIARLGHSAAMISGVGDDDFGRCILERFRRDGVDCSRILVVPNQATGVAFVTYFPDGSRRFLYHWDNTPAVMARRPDPDLIQEPRFLHVMGCALMPNDLFRAEVFETVKLFASKGARVSFDPNIRFELLGGRTAESIIGPVIEHSSVLLPGERELQLLSGIEDIDAAARRLLSRPRMEIIVVKRGSRGCTVYSRDGRIDVPPYRVQEVDPTGAGDCFDAGFICGLLEGKSLEESARVAAAAGALNAAAFGPMEGDISPRSIAAVQAR